MVDYHYCNRIDHFVAAQYLKPFFHRLPGLYFSCFRTFALLQFLWLNNSVLNFDRRGFHPHSTIPFRIAIRQAYSGDKKKYGTYNSPGRQPVATSAVRSPGSVRLRGPVWNHRILIEKLWTGRDSSNVGFQQSQKIFQRKATLCPANPDSV